MFRFMLPILWFFVFAAPVLGQPAGLVASLRECKPLQDPMQRLACYDQIPTPALPSGSALPVDIEDVLIHGVDMKDIKVRINGFVECPDVDLCKLLGDGFRRGIYFTTRDLDRADVRELLDCELNYARRHRRCIAAIQGIMQFDDKGVPYLNAFGAISWTERPKK